MQTARGARPLAGADAHAAQRRRSTAASSATITPSRKSSSSRCRDSSSPAISTARKARRAASRRCSVRTGIGRMRASTIRSDAEMKKELDSGGEVLPESGRSMFQSIGVQLARMGCVAFVYDMLGDCDSPADQLRRRAQVRQAAAGDEHAARTGASSARRPRRTRRASWACKRGTRSARSISSHRCPDVDPKRLGCTGASGGGTQTMMLAALDPRLAVSCPAVMVSTAMQGGCTCENASLLRVGTGNIEIAALFAPKPQGHDRRRTIGRRRCQTKGFPELQQLYAMMGAPENVALWPHAALPAQLQLRHARAHLRVVQHALPPRPRRRSSSPSATTRCSQHEQLTVWDARASRAAGRRRLRAQAAPLVARRRASADREGAMRRRSRGRRGAR